MSTNKTNELSKIVFVAAFMLAVFLAGGIFALKGMQPFRFFYQGYTHFITLLYEINQTHPMYLLKRRYSKQGVVSYNKDKAFDGYTVLQGAFEDGVQLRLIDMSGNIINQWMVDFFKIWPNPNHLYPERIIPKSKFNYHTQGMLVEPDGSAIVIVGDYGAVKFDRCSNVIWTLDRMTHHTVTRDDEGGYWFAAHQDLRNIPDRFLKLLKLSRSELEKKSLSPGNMGTVENTLLYVSAEGKILKEFSVLQALINAGLEREMFDAIEIKKTDPTHINDIEIVTNELAEKIPGVKKGDLLVSIRQMHMLAIFDQKNGKLKWHFQGPWVRQHDPDIMPNGNIVVYNNGLLNLNRKLSSNLMELDPSTGNVNVIYPKDEKTVFFTNILGSHQYLSNGNRLIVESRAGRVFEIDENGETVWDFIAAYDSQYAALIEVAERYEKSYFSVDSWQCG